jgi:hypothetical protein
VHHPSTGVIACGAEEGANVSQQLQNQANGLRRIVVRLAAMVEACSWLAMNQTTMIRGAGTAIPAPAELFMLEPEVSVTPLRAVAVMCESSGCEHTATQLVTITLQGSHSELRALCEAHAALLKAKPPVSEAGRVARQAVA